VARDNIHGAPVISLTLSAVISSTLYYNCGGVKDLILLCGRILLLLALLTLIISVTTSWLNSFKSSQVYLKEEKNKKRQKLARKKHKPQGEKASRYIENVLRPH